MEGKVDFYCRNNLNGNNSLNKEYETYNVNKFRL